MEKSTSLLQKQIYLLAALLFGSFFVFGTFFPDTWWSTHWLAYGNPLIRFPWLAAGIILLLWPSLPGDKRSTPGFLNKHSTSKGYILGFSLIAGLLMYLFPMPFDFYGDAIEIVDSLDKTIQSLPEGTHESFFNLSLGPWAGHQKVLGLATYIAYLSGTSYRGAFVILDSVCGAIFIAVWLNFIHQIFQKNSWRLLMALAGICAPFMLTYWGHCESYAVVYLLFLVFCTQLVYYVQKPTSQRLAFLIASFLLCLLFHSVALLFLPGLALIFIHHFYKETRMSRFFSSWKGIGLGLVLPILIAGLVLYIFVFEDYNDQRSFMETAKEFDRLFLPLLSPPAPLDKYNLFSLNHISDYFFEILLWSPLALMLLLVSLLLSARKISWNSLLIQVTGLNLGLFVAFFFMLNPLLSMQMDWDLMAIPAIPLLICATVLLRESKEHLSIQKLLPMGLGLSLLCIPAFTLHHQPDLHSQRLESLGKRIYSSYYEWTHSVLDASMTTRSFDSRKAYDAYKQALLQKLENHSAPGIDYEMSRMYTQEGRYYLRDAKQPAEALPWLEKAYYFFPKGKNEILYLLEAKFLLEDFEKAYQLSLELIAIDYPSPVKAQAIAVECAIRAGKIQEAFAHIQKHLALDPENALMQELESRIRAGETESLVDIYSR